MVGQLWAFGCFAQDETSASAGVSAATESEAAARPMTMVLVMGNTPSLERCDRLMRRRHKQTPIPAGVLSPKRTQGGCVAPRFAAASIAAVGLKAKVAKGA
jgi:hypothetical protein